jgi:hypothetical protein
MSKPLLVFAGTALIAGAAIAASVPASALGLGEAGELEHARANARAGGPVSDRDAELLDRYGCLSGTDNPYCRPYHRDERRHRARHRRPIEQ